MPTTVATAAAAPEPKSSRLPAAPAARRELSVEEIHFITADRVRRCQALKASSGAINIGPVAFVLS
jgi:hypothetical protein